MKLSRRQREQRRTVRVIGVAVLLVLIAAPLGIWWMGAGSSNGPVVTVYKSAQCQCCHQWMRHLAAAGFKVQRGADDEWPTVRARFGLQPALQACHTAVVDGLVIEGHVPAVDVRRILAKREGAVGLVLPGMPEGSPGMESAHPQAYTVLALYPGGEVRPFAQHAP